MKWAEFLEKSWQARPDQEVVVQDEKMHYEDLRVKVVGIEFTQDYVIIQTEGME